MSDKPLGGAARPKMQWYPLFIDDFDLDTRTWPIEAKGALISLMNEQWREGTLPNNQPRLARIAGAWDPEQWKFIWNDYLRHKFHEIEPGRLVNHRLHRERMRIEKKGEQAKKAALARWNKETGDAEPDADDMRTHAKTDADAYANQEPRTKNQDKKNSPTVRVPCQQIVDLYHEHCPMLPRVKVLNEKRKRAIRARWKTFQFEAKGQQRKFDSLETWAKYFTFIAEKCSFMHGINDRGWVANFDFCIRESGMVNVMENKYVDRKK